MATTTRTARNRRREADDAGSSSAGELTRQRILDAAEKLFAEHGYANVSVRTVTTKARQNLAAVNYHFGSKDGLLEAVYLRRGHLLNEEREQLLREAEAAGSPAPLETVLRAMLLPAIRWSMDGKGGRATFIRFLFRSYHDSTPALKQLRLKEAETLRTMMLPRLRAVLPGMPDGDLLWGIQFALGAMHYTIGDFKWSKAVSGGTIDTYDIERIAERLVTFAAGGLRQLVERREGMDRRAGDGSSRAGDLIHTLSDLD